MHENNSNGSSNDILDQALNELVEAENANIQDVEARSASDDWVDAIFDETEPSKGNNPQSLSPPAEQAEENDEVDRQVIADAERTSQTEQSKKMEKIETDTSSGLNDALGEQVDETEFPDVPFLADEEHALDGGIEEMLDDAGELDSIEDVSNKDELDSTIKPSEETDDVASNDNHTSDISGDDESTEDYDEILQGMLDRPEANYHVKGGEQPPFDQDSGGDIVGDEDEENDIDTLLGGPDLTDDAQDEQEAATEENDIDTLLGGPDLTDDAQDEQEAATEENDIDA
ncbi:hypothetical protein, partial [Alteromonas sp. 14N.309.X.WAT.G.H12]|uniref:hypothetical protein n=1 Tax=Alteromonas sp. 14N.309.X.WAT.G.H12 TaxID=3120824 RepID=UPI002FD14EC4